jgi:hypothetical protein
VKKTSCCSTCLPGGVQPISNIKSFGIGANLAGNILFL